MIDDTPMHLCLIGNSHLPALKLAWEGRIKARFPHITTTFFAAPRYMTHRLKVHRGCLTAPTDELRRILIHTSGGHEKIDPQKYDMFLFYGFRSRMNEIVPVWDALPDKSAALEEFWQPHKLLHAVKKIRRITDKPVFAGLQPLNARHENPDWPASAYARFVEQSNQEIFRPRAATLIPQPAATITPNGITNRKYLRDAPPLSESKNRPAKPYSKADFTHMNAEYGSLWWQSFLQSRAFRQACQRKD